MQSLFVLNSFLNSIKLMGGINCGNCIQSSKKDKSELTIDFDENKAREAAGRSNYEEDAIKAKAISLGTTNNRTIEPSEIESSVVDNIKSQIKNSLEDTSTQLLIDRDLSSILESEFLEIYNWIKHCSLYTNTIDKTDNSAETSKLLAVMPAIKYPNGDIYCGSWNSELKREGFGSFIDSQNDTVYEGNWVNDYPTGKGVLFNSDGQCYIGEFANGLYSNEGLFFVLLSNDRNSSTKSVSSNFESLLSESINFSNFSIRYLIQGQFRESQPHGICKEMYSDGSYFEGVYQDGIRQSGKYFFENGSTYEGEYKDNNPEGEGTLIFPNGNKFKGFIIGGSFQGSGEFSWVEECITFRGIYKSNIKEGPGIYEQIDQNNDKKIIKGTWVGGKLHGYSSYSDSETTYESDWRFGRFIKKRMQSEEKVLN